MSDLKALIDWERGTIVFSGPATYRAKDDIKELGHARFDWDTKSWEVTPDNLIGLDLRKKFSQVDVEEKGMKPLELAVVPSPSSLAEVPEGFSVKELMAQLKSALAKAFPETVFVRGVIRKVKRTNHIYLELADLAESTEHLDCVIWQNDVDKVCTRLKEAGFELETDLEVMFEVRVGLNNRRGSISLTIRSIVVEYTIGKLAAERDKTNERLKKEGLFERNKKLRLSFLPTRLGIITSGAGTVINDFRASLEQANFGFELFWVKVSVQGRGAKSEIRSAFKKLQGVPELDAILLFRGGGSAAELGLFNDYDIAKAICVCPVPVISAIGHETDQCASQDVSCQGGGVPKDVGRFFADIIINLREDLKSNVRGVKEAVRHLLELTESTLVGSVSTISQASYRVVNQIEGNIIRLQSAIPALVDLSYRKALQRVLDISRPIPPFADRIAGGARLRITSCLGQTRSLVKGVLVREESRLSRFFALSQQVVLLVGYREAALEKYESILESLKPEVQLKRGFALVRNGSPRRLVRLGSELKNGERVDIEFYDKTRMATVSDK